MYNYKNSSKIADQIYEKLFQILTTKILTFTTSQFQQGTHTKSKMQNLNSGAKRKEKVSSVFYYICVLENPHPEPRPAIDQLPGYGKIGTLLFKNNSGSAISNLFIHSIKNKMKINYENVSSYISVLYQCINFSQICHIIP